MSIYNLHRPAAITQLIEGTYITNLMYAIWCSREDLRIAFDLNSKDGQLQFLEWCKVCLPREYGIDSLPSNAQSDESDSRSSAVWPSINYPLLVRAEPFLAQIGKLFSSRTRARCKAVWNHILAKSARRVSRNLRPSGQAEQIISINTISEQRISQPGANLIGYAFSESGMGEHVRMSAASFSKTKVDFGVIDFDYGVPSRKKALLRHGSLELSNRYKANIFHINADQMIQIYTKLGEGFFSDRVNISYPFWELSKFPSEWTPFLNVMDEIWAPTKFIQESIASATSKPVQYMPVSIELPSVVKRGRRCFCIPDTSFAFLVTFDFFSYIHRKNPWAAIRAFMLAFPKLNENVSLIIKVMNADESSADWQKLQDIAKTDKRVILINKVMKIDELLSLKLACDCYVSLHRAEGLGRGPMEAMLLGKPTIITNYSGSTDYTNEDISCPVKFSLTPIKKGQYIHFQDQVWADPDVDHAAFYMKKLAVDNKFAINLGTKARQFISENYSPKRCGARYAKRLGDLGVI